LVLIIHTIPYPLAIPHLVFGMGTRYPTVEALTLT
jgi:hypothetical protein